MSKTKKIPSFKNEAEERIFGKKMILLIMLTGSLQNQFHYQN